MTATHSALAKLGALSARLGRDPLLVQASGGNTSIKLDGELWIKASGKWLARADEHNIFVPVPLQPGATENCHCEVERHSLRASIETAMHSILPHRVVIHVHSVQVLAWAVRADGPERLAERLAGIDWCWIPYVTSGLPLARAIQEALTDSPQACVFVLANHGLVVCGDDCETAEALLRTVEARVAATPRPARSCDSALIAEIANRPEWRVPASARIHALGTDDVSFAILKAGVLYPCQAMFLGTSVPSRPSQPFWIVEGRGVVIAAGMTSAQLAILNGLAEVVQRIDPSAPLRYMDDVELSTLLSEDAHHYRQSAESNASADYSN